MSNIRPLNSDLQKAAEELLGEEPSRIGEDLKALKAWIQQQPHLRANTDDQFLLAFLRGCKYSLEKSKSKIDKFFTLRAKFPELFGLNDIDNVRFRELLRMGLFCYLPTPLHGNGPRLAVMRSGAYPADKYSIEECMQVANAFQEILLLDDDYANVNGIIYITDLKGATMAHMFQWTPSVMKKLTVYAQEAMPLRPKAVHFVNTISGFEPVFNMMKPMLSSKLQKRVFVHGAKMEMLTKEIPLKYLPKEYGGENGSIAEIAVEWEKKIDQHREYFKKSTAFGTDEKLRPGKPLDIDNMFGIDGSFRKLNVD